MKLCPIYFHEQPLSSSPYHPDSSPRRVLVGFPDSGALTTTSFQLQLHWKSRKKLFRETSDLPTGSFHAWTITFSSFCTVYKGYEGRRPWSTTTIQITSSTGEPCFNRAASFNFWRWSTKAWVRFLPLDRRSKNFRTSRNSNVSHLTTRSENSPEVLYPSKVRSKVPNSLWRSCSAPENKVGAWIWATRLSTPSALPKNNWHRFPLCCFQVCLSIPPQAGRNHCGARGISLKYFLSWHKFQDTRLAHVF